jgi:hypothetical protein
VELVVPVALKVERQIQRYDQIILKLPWSIADNPADIGVLCHPGRQPPLTFNQGHTLPRAHSPQLNPQIVGKKATQRLAQGRALRVARVVVLDPLSKILLARRPPVSGRPIRADPRVQKSQCLMLAATIGHDQWGQLPKPPPVYTVLGGNW